MKKSLALLALLASIGAASAQEANSNSGSASNSGAQSGSISGVQSSNSGNTTAIGNANTSQSGSQSTSGAQSGSQSGALGNVVNVDLSGPANISSSSTNANSISGGTNNTDNVKYSGTIENKSSGGTTDTVNQNVRYSGTQTVKNVPGIAMSGPASGPCTGASGGLGVAGPGFGVGLNGAKVDDGCTVRENTRVLGQVFQSLDSADPLKAQAKSALMKSMSILEAMNDKIGGDYLPKAEPKQAAAPAPVVASSQPAPVGGYTGNDPYVKARMGVK